MKKTRLELDTPSVETFETAAPDGERGTVHGMVGTHRGNPSCYRTGCCEDTWNTCADSCGC